MKRLLLSVALVLLLFTLPGCVSVDKTEKYDYKYTGGAFFWKAEYTVKGRGVYTKIGDTLHYNSSTNTVFTLTYTGNLKDLAQVKRLTYSYTSSACSNMSSEDFSLSPLTQRVFTNQCEGSGAVERPDEAIHVEVQLDDKVIKFDLRGN